ncbi:MAG: sporulation protein YqfD, partial [Clostridiales bacterium]|nr:sporulation protein YqfD [Clostridiales bacterium]
DFTEIKPKVTAPPTEPCDIVAARDGIIISAATSAGTPLVKAGDVVRAGDVLVSGKLEIGNEESGIKYEYVHAQSEIWAKTFYNFSFDVPLLYEERAYTGRKSSGYVLTIVDKDIKLSKAPVPFTKNEKITDVKRLSFGKNYPLPFYLTKTTFKEFTNIPVERSVEQAMKIGAETVSERIFREFGFAAVVSAQDISYEEKEKAVSVNARITLIERIGDERTN